MPISTCLKKLDFPRVGREQSQVQENFCARPFFKKAAIYEKQNSRVGVSR